MTYDEVAKYIDRKLVWLPSGMSQVTRDDYYKIVDDFSAILINNPPEELLCQ